MVAGFLYDMFVLHIHQQRGYRKPISLQPYTMALAIKDHVDQFQFVERFVLEALPTSFM